MNGACHAPASSTKWRNVGGALRSVESCWSGGYGAITRAPIAQAVTSASAMPPIDVASETRRDAGRGLIVPAIRSLTGPRIDDRERDVGHERPEREKHRSGGSAAGDKIDVAGAERVEHQLSEPRPRRHGLDRERSAEQRADHETVHGNRRPQRRS